MSYADRVFVDMCEEIINRGTGSQGMEVRPRWEDGTPAHTITRFGVVNRDDLSSEFPANTLRHRDALDLAAEVQQHPGPEIFGLG